MSPPVVDQILSNHYNEIVSILFTKRSTGTDRLLNGRLGVKQFITGAGMNYDPAEYGLFVIYDMQNAGYRCVGFDNIKEIRCGGNVYTA